MDELMARLEAQVGVNTATAGDLIAMVLQFLAREAPPEAMAPLVARHPWVAEVLAANPHHRPAHHAGAPSDRHFGGMAKLMEVADQMMDAGLTMPDVQKTVRVVVDYARESVGDAPVDRLVRAVPGLRHAI